MRVLHCIPTFFGAGSETMLAGLAGRLHQRGLDVHVAFLSGGPNLRTLEEAGVQTHPIRSRSFYDPTIPLRIMHLIRRIRPDVVQTWLTQMDVLGGPPTQLAGVPHVLSEGSSAWAYPPTWKNRLRVRVGRRATAIIANSQGGADYWKDISPAPCWVIPNGLPIADIQASTPATRAELGLGADRPIILFVGRLHPEKNIATVSAAMLRAVEESQAAAVFCGYGIFQDELERMVAERGLADRVRIMGFVENVWSFMKLADVMVSVTPYEGRPNAVLEAMICGCPLIVSDIPAHREILSTSEASFVPHDDRDAIAQAILAAVRDPGAARQRATRAGQREGMLSLASYAEAHHQVYEAVTNGRSIT